MTADRGSDARSFDRIAAQGGRGRIPTQRDRKVQRSVDPAPYHFRNLIDRLLNNQKHNRPLATWHETTARNHAAAVPMASPRLWRRSQAFAV